MDDLTFGTRDKRGNWKPNERLEIAPLFVFPPRPLAFLRWLPGYFLPWNALFAAAAVAYWHLVVGSDGTYEGPAGEATFGARLVNATGACP